MSAVKWGENKRLRNTYYGMLQRCYNPNFKQFKDYGGRGIIVCQEWRENPQLFMDWALLNGYINSEFGCYNSLDRIDNDNGYSPENCRWVNAEQQAANKRNSGCAQRYEFMGNQYTLKELTTIIGKSDSYISVRLKAGYTPLQISEMAKNASCGKRLDYCLNSRPANPDQAEK